MAFVSCPTVYIAFKVRFFISQTSMIHPAPFCQKCSFPTKEILLLEYDTRFSAIAGAAFVHYDLNQPLSFSGAEALQNTIDVVIVDPPFHSEARNL